MQLLVISHRTIHTSRRDIPAKRRPFKAVSVAPKTLEDNIRLKQLEKGVTQQQIVISLDFLLTLFSDQNGPSHELNILTVTWELRVQLRCF